MNLLSDLQLLQLPSQCRTNDQTLSAVIEYDEPESEAGGLVECDASGNNFDGQKATEGILTAESKKEMVNMLIQLGEPPSVYDRRNDMDENVLIRDHMICHKKGTHTEEMLKTLKANAAYCSVSKAGTQNLESVTEEEEVNFFSAPSNFYVDSYNYSKLYLLKLIQWLIGLESIFIEKERSL